MKALTIWQPWASLIMVGAKPYEWRRWRAPAYATNQEIIIHAGTRRVVMGEVEDLIHQLVFDQGFGTGLDRAKALALLQPVLAGTLKLPTAAGLGTVWLGDPRRALEITNGVADSDRIDEHVWGWPVTVLSKFAEPLPIKGHQGFWNWPDASTATDIFTGDQA